MQKTYKNRQSRQQILISEGLTYLFALSQITKLVYLGQQCVIIFFHIRVISMQ